VVDDDLQQADAKVISRAVVPGSPYYPQKSVIYTIALFFAAAIGIALSIVLELLDNGFRTTKQLEEMTGYPTLGSVPKLSRQDRHEYPHNVAAKKPNSQFGEAVGSIRTSLLLTGVDQVPKVVLVTSSVPGEGKTSISLCLSSMAARAGQRAIVVDCDLRRAGLHQTLGVSNNLGLSNYLTGQVELSEVIDMEPSTGLHYITAGARVPHPTDLLGSQQMYGLLHQLSSSYDLVVLDTPPLLAVSDALVLVREADRTIFVVRWEKTRRDFVAAAMRQLTESGAKIAGLVMSQVDLKKQGSGSYSSGSGYYYGDGPKYYSD
jgi:polysaccharide biosynthesis transport protein